MDLFDRLKNNPGPLGQHADAEGYYIFPKLEGSEPVAKIIFFASIIFLLTSIEVLLFNLAHPFIQSILFFLNRKEIP